MDAPAPEPTRPRLLVVDDDTGVCALLRLVLKNQYDVTAVHEAETALERLCEGFDAIVTDYALPDLDGIGFVERLRSGEENARIPVLMMSGHASQVRDRAIAAGVNVFLDKPFTLASLRAGLESLLVDVRVRFVA